VHREGEGRSVAPGVAHNRPQAKHATRAEANRGGRRQSSVVARKQAIHPRGGLLPQTSEVLLNLALASVVTSVGFVVIAMD
jgi:hypothetical protein